MGLGRFVGAIIPMKFCTIPEGKVIRRKLPPEKTKEVTKIAIRKPHERLQSIGAAFDILNYGRSEYMQVSRTQPIPDSGTTSAVHLLIIKSSVQQFGMQVNRTADVVSLQARVLDPPTLMYGLRSRQPAIVCFPLNPEQFLFHLS